MRPHCHLVAGLNFAKIHFERSLAFDLLFKKWKVGVSGGYCLTSRKMKGYEGHGVGGAKFKQNVLWTPKLRKAIGPIPSVEHSPTPTDNLAAQDAECGTSELPRSLPCLPWNSAGPFSQYKISKALEIKNSNVGNLVLESIKQNKTNPPSIGVTWIKEVLVIPFSNTSQ